MSKLAPCSSGQEHRLGRSRSVEDVWRHDDADSADDSSCICHKHNGEGLLSSGACRSSYCGASSVRCHDAHCDFDSDAESAESWAEERHVSYYEWISQPRPAVRPPGLPRPPRRIESAPCFNKWGAAAAAAACQQPRQPLAACGSTSSWADDEDDEEELDLGSLADWMKEGLAEQAAGCTGATEGTALRCQPVSSVECAGPEPVAGPQLEDGAAPAAPAAVPKAAPAEVPADASAPGQPQQLQQLPLLQAAPDLVTGFSCPGVARLVLSQSPAAGKAGARCSSSEAEAQEEGCEEEEDAGDDACSEPTSPGSSDCGCGLDGSSNLGLGSEGSGSRCCSSLSLSSWDTAPLTRHGSLTEEEAVADCEACGVLCAGGCYPGHGFSVCGPAAALEEPGLMRPCSPGPSGLGTAAACVSSSGCIAFSAVVTASGKALLDVAQLGVACGETGAVVAAAYSCYTYGVGVYGAAAADGVPAADLLACGLSSSSSSGGASTCACTLVSPTPMACWETSAWEQRIAVQQHQHLMAAAACAADVAECPAWLEPTLGLMLSQVVAEALWGEDF